KIQKLKILLGNSSVKRGTPSESYHTDSNPSTGGGGSNLSDVGTNVDSNNQQQTIHSQQQAEQCVPSQQDQQQQCDEVQIVSHHQHVTQIHQPTTQMTHITFVDDESSCDSRWADGDISDVLIKTLADAHANTNTKLDLIHEMFRKPPVSI
uniref:Uncharacterized protein n=1 Tax=Megaselia scalaris TaxID=36166 RepID=T1GPM4_MEGSC